MNDPEDLRIDWSDPDPALISAVVVAFASDFLFGAGILTLGIVPVGLILAFVGLASHYMAALVIALIFWPRLKSPKAIAEDNPGINKTINEAINHLINPRVALVVFLVMPTPLLIVGIGVAIVLQNRIVKLLIDLTVKLAVIGVATGGVGDIAEGAAAAGELGAAAAEGAGTAAEATAATADASGAAAEAAGAAGRTGELKQGATEAERGGFRDRFGREARGRLRSGSPEGEDGEEGEGEDPESEDELSAEERELEDILRGDYVGRVLREAVGAEELLAQIGQSADSGGVSRKQGHRTGANGYNREVDLRKTG